MLTVRNNTTRSEKALQLRLDEALANKAVNANMGSREKKLVVARRVPSETSSKTSGSSSSTFSATNVFPRTKPTNREEKKRSASTPAANRNVLFAVSEPARPSRTDRGEYYLRQYRKQTHSAEGWREVRITQYEYRPPS